MRLLRYLVYAILAYIVWKIVKLAISMREHRERPEQPPVDFPTDRSYKNIEDADFEDITRDPDKPA